MDDIEKQNYIAQEFKRAFYKLENHDLAAAESIFESVALTHDIPMAWIYIGNIKFVQLPTGESTVQQALNCFSRATTLNPSGKGEYQGTYIKLSLQQLNILKDSWYAIKKHGTKASHSRLWNAAALGIAAGLGNQRSSSGNNTFRGTAGVAGAAYAINRMQKNTQTARTAKEELAMIEETMRQILASVKIFCSDNAVLYLPFVEKIGNFGFSDKVLSAIN